MYLVRKMALFFLLVLVACGRNEPKDDELTTQEKLELVGEKRQTYLELIPSVQDANGFIMVDECDSTLFSGLVRVAGATVNLRAARAADGQWFRRPLSYEPCYPKHSESTISRDMLLGVMWTAWKTKDLELAQNLFDYGVDNAWIMGEGGLGETLFSPALQATLAELVFRLGGPDHPVYRAFPQSWPTGYYDYVLHLQMLHIELRGQLTGSITDDMLEVVKDAASREPDNALVALLYGKYVSGNADRTADLLLNARWWPGNRLPTLSDRKSDWITQRRERDAEGQPNPDWLPVSDAPAVVYSGGDFLFPATLLLEHFK